MIMTSESNGMKPCISLTMMQAAEDTSMVSEDCLKKIQERCGLSQQRDLAPFRFVGNESTNVSNLAKRNVKALGPCGGNPEWLTKRKEKDRRLQQLANGSTPLPQKSPVASVLELHDEEKKSWG
jgi:hypothetical protein